MSKKIIVIGGSGHIGSYLIPRLVKLEHSVVSVSRGLSKAYLDDTAWAWEKVQQLTLDRRDENFGKKIAALKPDIVIDMLAFEPPDVWPLVHALMDTGKIQHYFFCSSIWVYSSLTAVPASEDAPVNPIDAYGKNKAAIEDGLKFISRDSGLPVTIFRPGHLVGKGWTPINPIGNFNRAVYEQIARGEELILPNLGRETLHHVHADDVASWIVQAIQNPGRSIGDIFNVVSEQAVTLKGYAEHLYGWFGKRPRLDFMPYREWIKRLEGDDKFTSHGHILRSSCHAIEKSRTQLGWRPRYSSLDAICESLPALMQTGQLTP